jgi:hypothetical protein
MTNEQKELMLHIIINTPMQGSFKEVKEAVKKIEKLIETIHELETTE